MSSFRDLPWSREQALCMSSFRSPFEKGEGQTKSASRLLQLCDYSIPRVTVREVDLDS